MNWLNDLTISHLVALGGYLLSLPLNLKIASSLPDDLNIFTIGVGVNNDLLSTRTWQGLARFEVELGRNLTIVDISVWNILFRGDTIIGRNPGSFKSLIISIIGISHPNHSILSSCRLRRIGLSANPISYRIDPSNSFDAF